MNEKKKESVDTGERERRDEEQGVRSERESEREI
jgi:hypothetical protein